MWGNVQIGTLYPDSRVERLIYEVMTHRALASDIVTMTLWRHDIVLNVTEDKSEHKTKLSATKVKYIVINGSISSVYKV